MSLAELESAALALTEKDRAALVLTIMDTLSEPAYDVSDEEVAQRDRELESGEVAPISHEELVQRIKASRR